MPRKKTDPPLAANWNVWGITEQELTDLKKVNLEISMGRSKLDEETQDLVIRATKNIMQMVSQIQRGGRVVPDVPTADKEQDLAKPKDSPIEKLRSLKIVG